MSNGNREIIIKEYTAAPVYLKNDNSGRHQWLIEFEKEPDNIDVFVNFVTPVRNTNFKFSF